MRANYIAPQMLNQILDKMHHVNALALRVSLHTGLRIEDVLRLKTAQIKRSQRVTVREMKTGKAKRLYIPGSLRDELLRASGSVFVFRGRKREDVHRTRQAVYMDIKRACRALKIATEHVSPHSVRKNYAVRLYELTGSLATVQDKLNHANPDVTVLYAFADKLAERYKPRKARHNGERSEPIKKAAPKGGPPSADRGRSGAKHGPRTAGAPAPKTGRHGASEARHERSRIPASEAKPSP